MLVRLLIDVIIYSALGPLLGPAFVTLAAEFDVSLQTFVGGVQGGLLLANAIGSVAFNTLAVKYGKRPFYLVTTLGLMVTCFWCAAAKSFASLVAARVLQGFLEGPVEALMPSSIADVWYVFVRLSMLCSSTHIPQVCSRTRVPFCNFHNCYALRNQSFSTNR
jgi:MFS family permease